jgi:isoleucyl-tRNA synthetase
LVAEWFLRVDPLRAQLRAAAQGVEWLPAHEGKRMDDWLLNMRDWCVSRKRYFGLPLPFYPCACGQLQVVGSKAELRERAVLPALVDALPELHRPFLDEVKLRCQCGREVARVLEVGDVWLDAGVVPLSTLGFENPERVAGGLGDGAAKGLTTADLPDHADFERWFPADFVCEMREQTRLWFYATLFVSVLMTGRAPYRRVLAYERVNDEEGKKMSKTGKHIPLEQIFERQGADALRFLYCSQRLTQPLALGDQALQEARGTLNLAWNTASFLAGYAELAGFAPVLSELEQPSNSAHPLDRWLTARSEQVTAAVSQALDDFDAATAARELAAYLDELSTFYLRASRERLKGGGREGAVTLWQALVRLTVLLSPFTPFLAESLWQRLVKAPCPEAEDSVFLVPWPQAASWDLEPLSEARSVRRALEAGRSARQAAGHRLRQPLTSACLSLDKQTLARYQEVLKAELNVQALSVLDDSDEPKEGWSLAESQDVRALVDVRLSPALVRLGERADARAAVQQARKQAGLRVGEPAELLVGREHPLAAPLARLDTRERHELGLVAVSPASGPDLRAEPVSRPRSSASPLA